MQHQTRQQYLKTTTIWFMIIVALFFDAIQALFDLILLGWIFVPIAYLTFWLWFKLHGISFFSAKRASTIGAGIAFELITAGLLPAMTFTVARIAFDYKFKELAGNRATGAANEQPADKNRDLGGTA